MYFQRVMCFAALLLPSISNANQFNLSLTHDLSQVLSGGLNEGNASRMLTVISYQANVISNTLFYADISLFRGENGAQDTGDLQAYSNIDETKHSHLFQLWLEHTVSDLPVRLKMGLVDGNTEFAYVNQAAEFIHSSMGMSPSIYYLPSYPKPSLSLNSFWLMAPNHQLAVAIYSDESNQFDDMLYISEYQYQLTATQIKLGIWHQQGITQFEADNKLNEMSSLQTATGFYSVVEGVIDAKQGSSQKTTQIDDNSFNSRHVGWYGQLAIANDNSPINLHVGAGLLFYRPFLRQSDLIGVGISYIKTSQLTHQSLKTNETALEFFYKYQINRFLSIKPNLQYIDNPAASLQAKDALVFTLRTELLL